MGEVKKLRKGFAGMDREKLRAICSAGGKAAHKAGTAHQWTTETARIAGRMGGKSASRKRQSNTQVSQTA